MTDLRETVARALHWNHCPIAGSWEKEFEEVKADYFEQADAALAAMPGPRVKALVWKKIHHQTQWAKCRYVSDRYIIEHRLHGEKFDLWVGHNATCATRFDTLEAAKAAAQADYERRILAALEGGDA